jgi:hypothetical protein
MASDRAFLRPNVVHPGTSLSSSAVTSVTVRLDDPQFGDCRVCGVRVARLGNGEAWHHIGGRMLEHVPELLARSR